MNSGNQEAPFDPYAELQLSPDAEPELVKAAFKALAKKYHPDRFSDPKKKAEAEAKMARLNAAQTLLQSGTYQPPPTRSEHPPAPPPPRPSPPQKETPSSASIVRERKKTPKPVPWAPFLLAACVFLVLLVLPGVFSGNHLEQALELERRGRLQDSLAHLNKAVAQSPHERELYRHRARIWTKLGEPEKAQVDLRNADLKNVISLPTPSVSGTDQVKSRNGENSESHVPRT